MKKTEKDLIIDYLEKSNNLTEGEFFNAVIALGETKDKTAIPYLLNLWKDFDSMSWMKRNGIAIALGELGAEEALPLLMDVMRNRKYLGSNGSIIYAISIKPLTAKDYFIDFIQLLCIGGIEVKFAAYYLIEHFWLDVDEATIKQSISILKKFKKVLKKHEPHIEELLKREEGEFRTINYINNVEANLRRRIE